MATARKSVMAVSCLRFVGLLLAVALLFVSIQTQEAYAETKKVSGTCKVITKLVESEIPCGDPCLDLGFVLLHGMLNSDDPDWNNVQQFAFIYGPDRKKDLGGLREAYKSCGVNTHPNGDQTFYQSEGTWEIIAGDPTSRTWKEEGWFIGGTGKFKGIRGKGVAKGKSTMTESTCEWEIEYEIR